MTAAQDKVRDRIRQLRERTTARGCTEVEAMEAAAKVASMMAAHGLSEGDIVFDEASSKCRHSSRSARQELWLVIGECTSTWVFVSVRGDGKHVGFLGRSGRPDIAVYLREVVDRAIDKELAAFRSGPFYKRRRSTKTRAAAAEDFLAGIVGRLRGRLRMLFLDAIAAGAAERRAASAEYDRRNPDSSSISRRKREERFSDATWEGYAAGARPTLTHGVAGGGKAPLQIGQEPWPS